MNQTPPRNPAQLLDDLESIRALLGDDQDPPLLTEALDPDGIPLLSEVVDADQIAGTHAATPEPAVRTAFRSLAERHLDHELRATAQAILQDVIDDFVPQIEAELKRRLETRADQLIGRSRP